MVRPEQLILCVALYFWKDLVQRFRFVELLGDIDFGCGGLEAFDLTLHASDDVLDVVLFNDIIVLGSIGHVIYGVFGFVLLTVRFFVVFGARGGLHSCVVFVVSLDQLAPVRPFRLPALIHGFIESVAISVDSEALIIREEHFGQRRLIVSMETARSLVLGDQRVHARNLEVLVSGWGPVPLHVEEPWRGRVLLDAEGLTEGGRHATWLVVLHLDLILFSFVVEVSMTSLL